MQKNVIQLLILFLTNFSFKGILIPQKVDFSVKILQPRHDDFLINVQEKICEFLRSENVNDFLFKLASVTFNKFR